MGGQMFRLLHPVNRVDSNGSLIREWQAIPIVDAEEALARSLCNVIKSLNKLNDYCVGTGRTYISNQIQDVTNEIIAIEVDIDYYAELVSV
jgi:hypothetical protein